MTKPALLAAVLATACGRFDFAARPDAPSRDGATLTDGDMMLTDGAPSDVAAPDAFVPVCSGAHSLCDTFDDPVFDSMWNSGGDVALDTTVSHHGPRSVRFRIPATLANNQVGAYIAYAGTKITSASQLWVRVWMRMDSRPASTNALELISLQQDGGLGNFLFARSNDTQLYGQFNTDNDSAGVPPPLNTWFCAVFHVVFSTGSSGSINFTSDVLPAMSITNTQTQGSPAVDTLALGPFFAQNNLDVNQPAMTVWIDDVIMHTSAVTCSD